MNRIQDAEAIEAPAVTSDGELLARFLNRRDDAAFAELVARHGPMVFGVCRRLLGQHADAEDCFQAAFLSLATHGRKLTDRPTVGPWLYTVARQIAVKALRSRRRRRWVFWESLPEPAAATASEATVDLDAALATLNEDERSAVVLCHLEGYTRAAAAKTLGWPEGTLSVRLSRALEKLRKKLGRPPLAVLAGAMVVMLPDQLPAATLASVRHLREGTLDVWAPPRTVELYRKAQPMKILHRAGPVVAALLAAILIMIGGITGWQWLQAQIDEKRKEPEAAAAPVQQAGKKKSFAAAVEEMQKQDEKQAPVKKSSVQLQVSTNVSQRAPKEDQLAPNAHRVATNVRRFSFKVNEVLGGAQIEHEFMHWSAMIPLLQQIAHNASAIEVAIESTNTLNRLEVNQLINNCKRAGIKTISYRGPEPFLGSANESMNAAAEKLSQFELDLTKSKEFLPDWTNGWYVIDKNIGFPKGSLAATVPLLQSIEECGGDLGPAFELLERFNRTEGANPKPVSDLAKQIGAKGGGERHSYVEIRLSRQASGQTRIAFTQQYPRGWSNSLTDGPAAIPALVNRLSESSKEQISLNIGLVGVKAANSTNNFSIVNPLHVNAALNACQRAGVKQVVYWGQEIFTGRKQEYSTVPIMGRPDSPPLVRTILGLGDLEGELPEESQGWAVINVAGRIYVARGEERKRLEHKSSVETLGEQQVEIERLAKLSADDFEKELAKKPSLLRGRWKKSVEEYKNWKK